MTEKEYIENNGVCPDHLKAYEELKEEAKKEGKTYVVNSNGVCIIDMSTNNEYGYYKVITYISIKDFPFFDINVIFPISGETKTIYY